MRAAVKGWVRYPFLLAGPLSAAMWTTVAIAGVVSTYTISNGFLQLLPAAFLFVAWYELIHLARAWLMRRRDVASVGVPLGQKARLQGFGIVAGLAVGIAGGGLNWRFGWVLALFCAVTLGFEAYWRRRWAQAGLRADPRMAVHWDADSEPAYEFRSQRHFQAKEYDKAKQLLEQALELKPDDAFVLYNLACAEALNGEPEAALEHLLEATARDARWVKRAQKDKDFASIRDDPRFPR
jgi:tetratricopeptide (TPR) repeat protein